MSDFYIVLWKESVFPHEQIERLISELEQKGLARIRWRFRARNVRVDDQVFLRKVGTKPRGIFGSGRVAGTPSVEIERDGKPHRGVPIEFGNLVDPRDKFLVPEHVLGQIVGTIRASGTLLDSARGKELADYIVMHDPFSVEEMTRSPEIALSEFSSRVAYLTTTEKDRLVKQRIGQDIFREELMRRWNGRCCVTGLEVPQLLRASHIRDWAKCETDAQRLDPFNGLLLAAHLDAAFDCGFITIGADGRVLVSSRLPEPAISLLGLNKPARIYGLEPKHQEYLEWHRKKYESVDSKDLVEKTRK